MIILIGIVILLAIIAGGYYWWQKNQAGQPWIPCDSLKNIPSAQYAPENVRTRFLECFPERATSSESSGQTPCETLKAIPSADYAPENVRARFLECFPERATSPNPKPVIPTPGASSAPAAQEQGGLTCDELKDMTAAQAQFAPPDVREKFLECFPERK